MACFKEVTPTSSKPVKLVKIQVQNRTSAYRTSAHYLRLINYSLVVGGTASYRWLGHCRRSEVYRASICPPRPMSKPSLHP